MTTRIRRTGPDRPTMTPALAVAFAVRALSGNVRPEGDAAALDRVITLEAVMNAAAGEPIPPGAMIPPTVLQDALAVLRGDGNVAPLLRAWGDAQNAIRGAYTRRPPGDPATWTSDRVVLTRAGWTATEAFLNRHVVYPFPVGEPTWEGVWSGDDPPASEPIALSAFEDPCRPDGIGSQVAVLAVDQDTGGVIIRITWGLAPNGQDGIDAILWPGEAVAFFRDGAGAMIRHVADPTRGVVEWKA